MSDRRRRLPAVSRLLEQAERAGLLEHTPRGLVTQAVRTVLAEARDTKTAEPEGGWLAAIRARLDRPRHSLRPVINATGVVLHTNLGRAPLAEPAQRAVAETLRYSTLEYDPVAGERDSRQQHVRQHLRALTGAADALVVNNAASALLLLLNELAEAGDTLVSRGELVEIGGAFRIPDILAKSGSTLIEVGTTNRTRLKDYALAVSPRTRLILKVHRSNFVVHGFVSEASVDELATLGRERGIPVVHDVGSGLLVSLERYGLRGEPLVRDSVAAGATVVCSGDKLLGGPQAGIIVGPEPIVARASRNPLARALRPDKVTLAALEATLALYHDPETALRHIPTLAMLTTNSDTLRARAERLAALIEGATTASGSSAVGGGAFPDAALATTLVVLPDPGAEALSQRLRAFDPPVITRIERDRVVLDPRTLADEELELVADAVRGTRGAGQGARDAGRGARDAE